MTPQERAAVLRRASADAVGGDWWDDHDNLAELWSWLEDRGQEPDSVVYYLQKPWKWTPEYVDMRDEQERPL
jgi:hypothetical protein